MFKVGKRRSNILYPNIKKIKASSLLETLIALTISSFLFGLVTVVFVQITSKSVSRSRIKVHELLNVYSTETIEQKSYFDGDYLQDEYVLRKKFSKNDSVPGLIKCEFFIYGNDNQLLEKMGKIVLNNED
jgi:hypothetical protein